MGCDIHTFVEIKDRDLDVWKLFEGQHFSNDSLFYSDGNYIGYTSKSGSIFEMRSYSLFAFLAGVRNYDQCMPISGRKGLPFDLSVEIASYYYEEWSNDAHSESWLSLKELLDFNYDMLFWNRRNGGVTLAKEGEGKVISYRENLGELYFKNLEELSELGDPENVRIVFWFDT